MRILIADDHGIVRGGLKLLIDRQPDMERGQHDPARDDDESQSVHDGLRCVVFGPDPIADPVTGW